MLENKTLVELRGIAQSFNVDNIFQKDKNQLLQDISLKRDSLIPEPAINIPKPEYDARLMSRPPSRKSTQREIEELLTPHISRGLRITFDNERWYMAIGKKTDEGTIRMPLATVLYCANKILE